MIDYFLAKDAPVNIEIKDKKGELVRRYSSNDTPVFADAKKLKIPSYWIRPFMALSPQGGLHRFVWDMHYTPLTGVEPEYPISAIYRDTPPVPTSPWVVPGEYTVTLTAGGKSYTQLLAVKMDPRVRMSEPELLEQFVLFKQLFEILATLEPIG